MLILLHPHSTHNSRRGMAIRHETREVRWLCKEGRSHGIRLQQEIS